MSLILSNRFAFLSYCGLMFIAMAFACKLQPEAGCTAAITCSNQGTCKNDGSCECNAEFTGTDCSTAESTTTTPATTINCKCQTIEITLKNAALAKQGSRQGSYQRGQIVNGKPSWTSTSNAIWYNVLSKDWGIGRIEKIGTSTVGIASDGDQGFSSCPFTVPNGKWKYSDGTRKFVVAPSGDISVKCVSVKTPVWSQSETGMVDDDGESEDLQ